MTKFIKSEAISIKSEVTKELEKVAAKYGATFNMGNISYGNEITFRMTLSKNSTNEHGDFIMTKEARTFLDRAAAMGLTQDVLNEEFIYAGNKIKITGYSTRSRKYPIKYTQNGKNYKCDVSYMKTMVRTSRPELFL